MSTQSYGDPRERAIPPPMPLANEAEVSLVGCCLMNASAYQAIAGRLEPGHFGQPVLGRIFEIIGSVIDSGKTADPITIGRLAAHEQGVAEIGGAAYIQQLARAAGIDMAIPDYADLIIDTWRRREIITRAWLAIQDASEPQQDRDALAIAQDLEDGLGSLADGDSGAGRPVTIRDAMVQAQAATEAAVKRGGAGGLATGFHVIDSRLGGLFPGHLVVLAGRPGMGKSALAQCIASNVAQRAEPVAMFSLEMDDTSIGWRELSARADVTTDDQMSGRLDMMAQMRTDEVIRNLDDIPLFLFDHGGIGLAEVGRQSEAIKRRHGLKLIVIDHLQCMRTKGKTENRRLELGAITGGLKTLAKRLGVPVLLLSQLSRAVESRDDKKPVLSDLRETGDIEQDADMVAMLYREEYYLQLAGEPTQRETEKEDAYQARRQNYFSALGRCAGYAELIFAKLRYGRPQSVRLRFSGAQSKFTDGG